MSITSPKFYSIAEVVAAAIANPVYDGHCIEPIEQTFARLRNKIDRVKRGIATLPDEP